MSVEIKNAVIDSAVISSYDGFLTVVLQLRYGGGCEQVFGGRALYFPPRDISNASVAGHFVWRSMEVAGAREWSEMKGKTIRVKADDESVSAIGHIIEEDWFCPSDDYREDRDV